MFGPGYVVLYVLVGLVHDFFRDEALDDDPAIGFKSFDDVFGTISLCKCG